MECRIHGLPIGFQWIWNCKNRKISICLRHKLKLNVLGGDDFVTGNPKYSLEVIILVGFMRLIVCDVDGCQMAMVFEIHGSLEFVDSGQISRILWHLNRSIIDTSYISCRRMKYDFFLKSPLSPYHVDSMKQHRLRPFLGSDIRVIFDDRGFFWVFIH
jgi:hypothetical protein